MGKLFNGFAKVALHIINSFCMNIRLHPSDYKQKAGPRVYKSGPAFLTPFKRLNRKPGAPQRTGFCWIK